MSTAPTQNQCQLTDNDRHNEEEKGAWSRGTGTHLMPALAMLRLVDLELEASFIYRVGPPSQTNKQNNVKERKSRE